MSVLVVTLDGQKYRLVEDLTLGELALFKTVGGIRLAELEAALAAGDPDVLIAFAMIVSARAGKPMSEADARMIRTFDIAEEDAESGVAVPPPVPVTASPPSGDAAAEPSLAILHAASGPR